MEDLLTNPIGSNLKDYEEAQQQAQQRPQIMQGLSRPSTGALTTNLLPNLNKLPSTLLPTSQTSIPVEIYNIDTGETVKRYNNVVDYQADTLIAKGGASKPSTVSSSDAWLSIFGNTVGKGLIGKSFGLPGMAAGALYGLGSSLTDIANINDQLYQQYLTDPERQVSLLATETEGADGEKVYKIDWSKAAGATAASGDYTKKAVDTSNTKAAWDAKGTGLVFTVSPTFAASDTYQEYVKERSQDFAGITAANDPNGQYLKTLNNELKDLESNYYATQEAISYYTAKYPKASEAAVEQAILNQQAGAFTKEDDLEQYEIKIYNDQGNLETQTARTYLDHFKDLDGKVEKDKYLSALNAKLDDPTISEDSKALILGQMRAIYWASQNESYKSYNGMAQKGNADYIGEQHLGPLQINDMLKILSLGNHYGDLTMLLEDDAAKSRIGSLGTIANMYASLKIMNGLEVAGKWGITQSAKGIGALGNKLLGEGNLVSKGADLLLNATDSLNGMGYIAVNSLGDAVKKAGLMTLDLGYQAAADATYDLAKLGLNKIVGKDVDFWSEFQQDLAMDLFFTYAHTGALQSAMAKAGLKGFSTNDVMRVIRDDATIKIDQDTGTKTITLKLEGKPETTVEVKPIEGDESGASDVGALTKAELSDAIAQTYYKLNNETSRRVASLITKLTENDKLRSFYRTWFDQYIDMRRLGYQALAETGDASDLIRLSNVANSYQLTSRKLYNFITGTGKEAYDNYLKGIDNFAAQTGKTAFSQEDYDYLNAKQEMTRAGVNYAKDSDAYKRAQDLYQPALDAVSKTDRVALDQFANVLSNFAKTLGAYERSEGLQTSEFYDMIDKYPGYYPIFAKVADTTSSLPVEYRRVHRTSDNPEALMAVSNFDNPNASIMRMLNNVIANATRAEQVRVIQDVASKLGDIEVVQDLVEKQAYEDLPVDTIIKKYNIAPETQMKMRKLADTDESYKAALEGIIKKSLLDKNSSDYAKAKKQIDQNITNPKAMNALGEVVLTKNVGGYKKGMTLGDVQSEFEDRMALSVSAIMQGAVSRNKKFKEYFSFKPKNTVDRIMQEFHEGINAFNPDAFATRISQELTNATPMVSYDQLIYANVPRTAEWHDELMQDPEIRSGEAAYDPTSDKKVKRAGAPIRVLTNGRVETYYLRGSNKKAQEKANAVAELLSSGLNLATKQTFSRLITNVAVRSAQLKRRLNSALLAGRALPNKVRDTQQAAIAVGASAVISPAKIFSDFISPDDYSEKELSQIYQVLDTIGAQARGFTENETAEEIRYGTIGSTLRRAGRPQATSTEETFAMRPVRRTANQIKNQFNLFTYNLKNIGKGGLSNVLMMPGDISEASTRGRSGQNEMLLEFTKQMELGQDFNTAIEKAYQKGVWAARTSTTDFGTKGTLTNMLARFTPFSYANFSDVATKVEQFAIDPTGVSTRALLYIGAYVANLASVLANESTRQKYMNMSDYDREHYAIIDMGNGNAMQIPIEESMSGILAPFRTFAEILIMKEPATFWKVFGSFLSALPVDLSGFTEGDMFNFQRGVESIISDYAPAFITETAQVMTGYNLFYGESAEVTPEDIVSQGGTYNGPEDLTTKSKNSKTLRYLSQLTNMPQWRLQEVVGTFGGSAGQQVIYLLDKLQGATDDETGGTSPWASFYKPFFGTGNNSESAFYDVVNKLEEYKKEVVVKLKSNENQQTLATGTELVELKTKHQDIINEYVAKVSDNIGNYLQVYEQIGGLSDKEAQRVYYLFDFYDDLESVGFSEGTAGRSAADKLESQYQVQQYAMTGEALSGLYTPNHLYRKSDGTYEWSTGYGQTAMNRLLNNRSKEYVAGLEKIASDNNLYAKKQAIQKQRDAIYDKDKLTKEDYAQLDKLAIQQDVLVMTAFWPYMQKYGTDFLTRNEVIDYLDDYFIPTSDWEVDKKGKYISSPNLNKRRGFTQSFIQKIAKNLGGK